MRVGAEVGHGVLSTIIAVGGEQAVLREHDPEAALDGILHGSKHASVTVVAEDEKRAVFRTEVVGDFTTESAE